LLVVACGGSSVVSRGLWW